MNKDNFEKFFDLTSKASTSDQLDHIYNITFNRSASRLNMNKKQLDNSRSNNNSKFQSKSTGFFAYDTGDTIDEIIPVTNDNNPPNLFLKPNIYNISNQKQEEQEQLQSNNNNSNSISPHQHFIAILFLHQTERTGKYLVNKLTEIWTGSSIIHVEIYFSHSDQSCIVSNSSPVAFVKKRYMNTGKRWEGIFFYGIPHENYDRIFRFCHSQLNKPFDSKSIYCFPMAYCQVIEEGWICSRLIFCALQEGYILPSDIAKEKVSPSKLLILLQQIPSDIKQRLIYQWFHTLGRPNPHYNNWS